MRHWYLLAKIWTCRQPQERPDAGAKFMYGGGPGWTETARGEGYFRLMMLGALEMLPIGGALSFGSRLEPTVPYAGTAALGLALSLGLCWLMRNQTPPSVIHFARDGKDPAQGSEGKLPALEQAKALVRALVEAINRRDWGRLDALVARDFLRHSSTHGQPEIRGRDQLRVFLIEESKTFPDGFETVHFLIAEGDLVAAHSGFCGTQLGPMGGLPASGRTLTADFISIYRIADGRIVEAWVEWDGLSGLLQLGHISPQSAGGVTPSEGRSRQGE